MGRARSSEKIRIFESQSKRGIASTVVARIIRAGGWVPRFARVWLCWPLRAPTKLYSLVPRLQSFIGALRSSRGLLGGLTTTFRSFAAKCHGSPSGSYPFFVLPYYICVLSRLTGRAREFASLKLPAPLRRSAHELRPNLQGVRNSRWGLLMSQVF